MDSIWVQTYRPIEVIVADDGSTDGTARVAAEHPSRPRCLRQERAGPAAARNLGLAAARGDFLAFVDAGDLWHPEKLARQISAIEARPEARLAVTGMRSFCSPELPDAERLNRDAGFTRPWIGYSCCALLASRRVFEEVGPFNPALTLGEDSEWFQRVAERGLAVEVVPEVLVYRRVHEGNLTRVLAEASRESFLRRESQHRPAPRPSGARGGLNHAHPVLVRAVLALHRGHRSAGHEAARRAPPARPRGGRGDLSRESAAARRRHAHQDIPIHRFGFLEALAGPRLDLYAEARRRLVRVKRAVRPDLVHMNFTGPSVLFRWQTQGAAPAPTLVAIRVAVPVRPPGDCRGRPGAWRARAAG